MSRYEFRVSGRLSERAQRAFGDYQEMRIVPARAETFLYVAVTDDAHLQGILALLANLGLHLISVNRMAEPLAEPGNGETRS